MTVIIAPKRTSTVSKVPTASDLYDGEMGVNTTDGKIYMRQGSSIKLVGSKAEGTVTSVGLTASAPLMVTNSPITSSGNIHIGWPSGVFPNMVLKGTGVATDPQFGTLNSNDITDISTGTYTPTITSVTNLASSSSPYGRYMKVGPMVKVFGQVTLKPASTGNIIFRISLPFASNIGINGDLVGTMHVPSNASGTGHILGHIAQDLAQVSFVSAVNTEFTAIYEFTYMVI